MAVHRRAREPGDGRRDTSNPAGARSHAYPSHDRLRTFSRDDSQREGSECGAADRRVVQDVPGTASEEELENATDPTIAIATFAAGASSVGTSQRQRREEQLDQTNASTSADPSSASVGPRPSLAAQVMRDEQHQA
jgi:hypothetical protein